jgi:hypothetical protein
MRRWRDEGRMREGEAKDDRVKGRMRGRGKDEGGGNDGGGWKEG